MHAEARAGELLRKKGGSEEPPNMRPPLSAGLKGKDHRQDAFPLSKNYGGSLEFKQDGFSIGCAKNFCFGFKIVAEQPRQ